MRHIPESLISALDSVCVRVQLGHTLTESMKKQPPIKVQKSLAEEWMDVRDRILNGQCEIQLLYSFVGRIKSEHKTQSKISQSVFLAKLQSYTLCSLALFLSIKHPLERPDPLLLILAFILLCLGHLTLSLTSRLVLYRFPLLDWNDLLLTFNCHLHSGQSPRASLFALTKKFHFYTLLPKDFKTSFTKHIQEFLNFEESQNLNFKTDSKISLRQKNILEFQAEALLQALWRSEPLTKSLEKFSALNQTVIDEELQRLTQLMSLASLFPLFLFHLPSILLLLYGPLIKLF